MSPTRRAAAVASGEDRESEVSGPPATAPAQAIAGFAKKHGVAVSDLGRQSTPRGDVVVARSRIRGQRLDEVLAPAVEDALKALPIPKVMRWGSGDALPLADGVRADAPVPVLVRGLVAVDQVALGRAHACALARGRVFCWGENADGQLGAPGSTPGTEPTTVAGLEGVVEIAAGGGHSCARLRDGTVACWGRSVEGQLGGATTEARA